MRIVTTVFWVLIIIIAISFAAINSHTVSLSLYVAEYEIYLPLLLLITLVIGAILGVLAMLPMLFKCRKNQRQYKQRYKQSEQEIKNLRNIPLKDSH